MKYKIITLTAILLLSSWSPVYSISAEDRRAINTDSVYFEPGSGECFVDTVPSQLPDSIPEPYRSTFTQAANEYNTDVFLLATVHHLEQANSYEIPVPEEWPGSAAGAEGPFQFVSNTWPSYAEDADGDGVENIQSIADAGYAAAHKLFDDGGERGNPLGSSTGTLVEDTLVYAMASYNAGARSASRSETVEDLPAETENYIAKGVEFYRELSGGQINLGGSANSSGCSGLGIGSDLVFPLRTTKTVIEAGSTNDAGVNATWCFNSTENCHGSYNAADIFAVEGTVVVAAVSGVVRSAYKSYASCAGCRDYSSVRIEGEDGNWYFYQHMDRESLSVSTGDFVEAGTRIGTVGDTEAAEFTAPHLHFDVAPERVGISRECVNTGGCQRAQELMIDSQPLLVDAYSNLPEGGL